MTSVVPRIFTDDVEGVVGFLRTVFEASGDVLDGRPSEIHIGDSVVVSSTDERPPFPAFLYVYVDDVDAAFARALDLGATGIEEPLDTHYGQRRAMVEDPFGNVFQIAT
ncbi:MAG TPA: VOC family protein [Gaiellaceae bacterium]|nr:VOC family protein [Gaiellaceae bacterium]